MTWHQWAEDLRQSPLQALTDLLRGSADIVPFERASPHDFLLAVLPRSSRIVSRALFGETSSGSIDAKTNADLSAHLDIGLSAWLRMQCEAPLPPARKLGAYVAQVCEALQLPLFFVLPNTLASLQENRIKWLQWLRSLTISAFRDPEYDYWQILAAQQADDKLQFYWQSFVTEAGRTRSVRYLNLGLLALAKLPLSEDDSLRNIRLQIQALISRYLRRRNLGVCALEEMADALRGVITRNPSLSASSYVAFLTETLAQLGDDKVLSVLSMLGLSSSSRTQNYISRIPTNAFRLQPPSRPEHTDESIRAIKRSTSLSQAWSIVQREVSSHEYFLHKSGDAYYFVRVLDRCARAFCDKYAVRDPEVQGRLFQWIHLALRLDPDEPRRWMLWELVLRKVDQPQRAQWVLWEMTRRFPDNVHCRLELARLLLVSRSSEDLIQANNLLQQVLKMDPHNLYAYSTLSQLAISREDWPQALHFAEEGLRIDSVDPSCSLLLAAAYARRNGPNDIQTAIDHLQRCILRDPVNSRFKSYLGLLQRRQKSGIEGLSPIFEDGETARIQTFTPEIDPAWRAFAESLRSWAAASAMEGVYAPAADDAILVERVLPLPQALQHAIARNEWDADVLDRCESSAQQEFPLETRLWRYLQILQSNSPSSSEHDRAKKAVELWIEAETNAAEQNDSSWVTYLKKQWCVLNSNIDGSVAYGVEWLKDLLGRYQPLPAPLFD